MRTRPAGVRACEMRGVHLLVDGLINLTSSPMRKKFRVGMLSNPKQVTEQILECEIKRGNSDES